MSLLHMIPELCTVVTIHGSLDCIVHFFQFITKKVIKFIRYQEEIIYLLLLASSIFIKQAIKNKIINVSTATACTSS